MSNNQFFLSVEQVLSILMDETPDKLYPKDRADNPDKTKNSYSSSELRAQAQLIANLYDNLALIDNDKALTTVSPSGLAYWEKQLFSAIQSSSLTYAQRQANLISKYRSSGGISLPAIRSVVAAILDPLGLPFAILPYSGQNNGTLQGAWVLEISTLEDDTWLAEMDPELGTGLGAGLIPLDCSLNYAAAGITSGQLLEIQKTAYAYEVQIYGVADAQTLALLDARLTALEPARSTHVIRNNVSLTPNPTQEGWSNSFLYWWVG